jgi:hypothetical protein
VVVDRPARATRALLAYGVAPLAVAGLTIFSFMRVPASLETVVGGVYLALTAVALAGNVYLESRRTAPTGPRASLPGVLTLAALPAAVLLLRARLGWAVLVGLPVLLALDLAGQPLLGAWVRRWRRH